MTFVEFLKTTQGILAAIIGIIVGSITIYNFFKEPPLQPPPPITYAYECTIKYSAKPLTNILTILDEKDSIWSKADGMVLFTHLTEGRHTFNIIFRQTIFPFNIYAGEGRVLHKEIELTNCLILDSINENKKRDIPLTALQIEKRAAPINTALPETNTNDSIQFAKITVPQISNIPTQPKEDPNDILSNLILHVTRFYDDKREDGQILYNYYLTGEEDLLQKIKTVYYQRKHESFEEYQTQEYFSSDDANKGFSFGGYQWGSVQQAKIILDLNDGQQSRPTFKTIIYDN